jgi:hypothetical protein
MNEDIACNDNSGAGEAALLEAYAAEHCQSWQDTAPSVDLIRYVDCNNREIAALLARVRPPSRLCHRSTCRRRHLPPARRFLSGLPASNDRQGGLMIGQAGGACGSLFTGRD